MAKTQKLSSTWTSKDGVLSFTIEARALDADKDSPAADSFSRSLNMGETFGEGYSSLNEAGKAAIEFGAWTALRNSTGSAADLAEAQEAVDRRLEAFSSGDWGAEREGQAVAFSASALIALAVERATKGAQTAAQAAEKLNAMADATCAQNSLGEFAKLEATDRAKVRKGIVDHIKSTKPAIAAALAQIESERAAAALKRKADAAAKAAAEAGEEDAVGL